MRFLKEITSLWNNNFNKGVTIFQITLMITMVLGAIIGNQLLIMFSMVSCLFGYFEPTNDRFAFESKSAKETK